MNKKIIIFASTFAALVACSESEKVVGGDYRGPECRFGKASERMAQFWYGME